ncbi:bifunctional metallophosphatase/5'-nucleotidase [Facklamia hominis]|uniref:5'-Nucleotidase C-terminal domain-containing protein n=1 Tax=Facklamia hominis CCUG 36813 TaxID=883111 RepID=K1LRG1_9LACT|nr:bifunctional UDP-sugar hydrolase/5'-nucleotidase [Facklamia hominis]EKB54692.1 hypothetical protein HMPREF9706_00882 [Facklamia hominis CCUG 36813]
MKTIRFLMTSDTHAQWLEHPDHPDHSLLNTAYLMKQLQSDPSVDLTLTIDLGDFIQGSSMATYTSTITHDARPYARALNAMNYDYHLFGNHEFNFGPDYYRPAYENLKGKILCANILDQATQSSLMGCPYEIIDFEGIKIGIIGVTTHYIPNWELPEHYQGVDFLDAFETVKHYVSLLRPQVDLLVVAYHGGFESDLETGQATEEDTGENQGYHMLSQIPGIDLFLSGHQHRQICQKVNGVLTLQPGYGGEKIASAKIVYDDGQIKQLDGELIDFRSVSQESAAVKSALEPEYEDSQAWLNQVLGHSLMQNSTQDILKARSQGHPFAEMINQLLLKETDADFSGVSLLNEHFFEFQGPITRKQLLAIYPFYNLIAVVEVSGADLYKIMEQNLNYFMLDEAGNLIVNPAYIEPKAQHFNYDLYSGFTCQVNLSQPVGQRVQKIIDERTNEAIDLDKVYRLAVTQYRAVGGGNYPQYREAPIITISSVDIQSLIQDALANPEKQDWDQINQHYGHLIYIN